MNAAPFSSIFSELTSQHLTLSQLNWIYRTSSNSQSIKCYFQIKSSFLILNSSCYSSLCAFLSFSDFLSVDDAVLSSLLFDFSSLDFTSSGLSVLFDFFSPESVFTSPASFSSFLSFEAASFSSFLFFDADSFWSFLSFELSSFVLLFASSVLVLFCSARKWTLNKIINFQFGKFIFQLAEVPSVDRVLNGLSVDAVYPILHLYPPETPVPSLSCRNLLLWSLLINGGKFEKGKKLGIFSTIIDMKVY